MLIFRERTDDMDIIIKALIFVSLFFLIAKLLEPVLSKKYSSALLSNKKNYTSALPAKLAWAVLPKKCVFRSLSLPIPGRDGDEINIGTVIVSRCGVFILCQIHGSGLIENSQEKKWKHLQNGRSADFDNPFTSQQDARSLLEFYAKSNGLEDVRAHTMILYTDPTLKFTVPQSRSVVYAGNFASKLSKMERVGRLSNMQVRSFCKLLTEINQGALLY